MTWQGCRWSIKNDIITITTPPNMSRKYGYHVLSKATAAGLTCTVFHHNQWGTRAQSRIIRGGSN